MVKGIPRRLRLLWDRIDTSFTAAAKHYFNYHLHVLRPGAPLRNKVHPTTVWKLLCDFAYIYGKGLIQVRAIFYFGIFICSATSMHQHLTKIAKDVENEI